MSDWFNGFWFGCCFSGILLSAIISWIINREPKYNVSEKPTTPEPIDD